MFLTLSERIPLWFCDSVHFSVNDRGPKNVDVETLDLPDKQMVEHAIACGVLIESESLDAVVSKKPADQPAKLTSEEARTNGLKSQATTNLKGSAKTIVSLLKKNRPGYKLLSIMLEIEKSKQKRKTVIKAIKNMLEATGGVSTIVDDSSDIEEIKISVI